MVGPGCAQGPDPYSHGALGEKQLPLGPVLSHHAVGENPGHRALWTPVLTGAPPEPTNVSPPFFPVLANEDPCWKVRVPSLHTWGVGHASHSPGRVTPGKEGPPVSRCPGVEQRAFGLSSVLRALHPVHFPTCWAAGHRHGGQPTGLNRSLPCSGLRI